MNNLFFSRPLNSAVFKADGSFVFIPKVGVARLELST